MKSADLVKIMDEWYKYDPKVILILNSELKSRNYETSYSLEKKQNEFSSKYKHTNIDEFLDKYLKNDNYFEFMQKGIDGVSETKKPSNKKKIIFTIIGAILGLPLSYYFQPEMVRQKMSLLDYTTKLNEVFEQKDLIGNVILGVVILAVIGFVVGYFMDKNETQKAD